MKTGQLQFNPASANHAGDFDSWTLEGDETGACICRCEDEEGNASLFSVVDGFGMIADAGLPTLAEAEHALRMLPEWDADYDADAAYHCPPPNQHG